MTWSSVKKPVKLLKKATQSTMIVGGKKDYSVVNFI